MDSHETLQLLKSFALRAGKPTVQYAQFLAALRSRAVQESEVESALRDLAGKGECALSPAQGAIVTITLPRFHLIALAEHYRHITVDPTRPFPSTDDFPVPVPPEDVASIDVKTQFVSVLDGSAAESREVVNLMFPAGAGSLLVPRDLVASSLVEAAVAKVSDYLHNGKNAAYAENKICGLMKGNEIVVKQLIEDVTSRPAKATAAVLSPNEMTFAFWTHLSNLLVQEFVRKAEKTSDDFGWCQAAYVTAYTVFFHKTAARKEQEKESDRKSLEVLVRKAPYVFSFDDMYDLKDSKGVAFVTKHTRGFIHEFLESKSARTEEEPLPYLLRLHVGPQNRDYFVQRDLLIPVFLRKLSECSEGLRERYINEWTEHLQKDADTPSMKTDTAFQKDVESRVKEGFPLLAALANGPVLALARVETSVAAESKTEMGRMFSGPTTLKPMSEMMGLSRAELLKRARTYLPFWMTVPLVSSLLRLLRRLSAGRQAKEAKRAAGSQPVSAAGSRAGQVPDAASEDAPAAKKPGPQRAKETPSASQPRKRTDSLATFRTAMQSLHAGFVPSGRTMDATLDELAEKWNPLYDPQKKLELVEDVNALVRDFIRPVKRAMLGKPPDAQRIVALAEKLRESKSLEKIKRKDYLMKYLELYIIKCLEVGL